MATSIMPFLYPARLVQRPRRMPVVCQLLRSLHDSAIRAEERREEEPQQQPEQRPRSKASRRINHSHIPFELPPNFEPEGTDATTDAEGRIRVGTGDIADGTITPLERQAFRRIFREISRRPPNEERAENAREIDTVGDDSGKASGNAGSEADSHRARINAIVSDASNDQVLVREPLRNYRREDSLSAAKEGRTDWKATHSRHRVLAQFPPSLRSAAGKALGINDVRRLLRQEEEQVANVEQDEASELHERVEALSPAQTARRERQEKMELAMLAKKTDTALWQYMQEQVFSLVGKWGLQEISGTSGSGKRTTRKKRALAEDRPLYPALLLHAQRLLESHFAGGTVSPLAFAVLPYVKKLGLASYVLGASTPLYNHLLHMRWRRQGDAPAVFALLQEMQRAGLVFDAATLAIVKSIEWHVVPLTREGRIDGGSMAEEHAMAAAAVRHLPDLAEVARQAAYWRQQVERSVLRRPQ
ncbi:hypothetical protein SEPCBS119000_004084 [Sporothrix epigloea]|uniref:Mtf2-like C-terminal domain-containing protein n=1 Tax=Sporothrix epigloea TaxID=1892477 RepID=A0ABP0DQ78_9PEZI